jgi:hypothetical protein
MYAGADFYRLYYRIYRSTVCKMLGLLNPSSPPTISQAVTSEALTLIDQGEIASDPADPVGLYHPFINTIQHPTDPEKDLLVVCTGGMTLITRVLAYGSPTAKEAPAPPDPESGSEPAPEPPYSKNNPYTIFANAGGPNINSFDITIETRYQAMRGDVSLKHGGRMTRAGGAAGKAATPGARLGTKAPAAAPAPKEGGEENK